MESTVRRILVPTDFSSTAENALALATRLARRFDAELHILHVRVLREDPHLDTPSQEQIDQLASSADQETKKALSHRDQGNEGVVTLPHLVRGL